MIERDEGGDDDSYNDDKMEVTYVDVIDKIIQGRVYKSSCTCI